MGDPLICTPRPAAPRMWSRPSRSASRRAPFPSRARRRTTASRSDPRATQVPQHREGPARAPGGPPRGLGHVARVGALNRLRRPFCGAPLARESPRRARKKVVRATLPTGGPSRKRWSGRRGRARRTRAALGTVTAESRPMLRCATATSAKLAREFAPAQLAAFRDRPKCRPRAPSSASRGRAMRAPCPRCPGSRATTRSWTTATTSASSAPAARACARPWAPPRRASRRPASRSSSPRGPTRSPPRAASTRRSGT